MTQTNPTTPAAHNNELDDAIADVKRLVSALNIVANAVIPEEDDEIREPIFAVIDAIGDKLDAVEMAIDAQTTQQKESEK